MAFDPPQNGVEPTRIGDIPKIKETLRQIETMATVKTALPLLKPFMRLLGIDSTGIEASLQDVEKLRADIKALSTIPDDFNDLLSERGWIIYDHLNLDVAKKAVALAKSNDFEGAEAPLVAYFNVDEIRRQMRLLVVIRGEVCQAHAAGTAWKGSGCPTPADMRATFQSQRLDGFELLSVEDQAAAVSLITVRRLFKSDDGPTEDTLTYRLIRVDSNHEIAAGTIPGTSWAIINWNW